MRHTPGPWSVDRNYVRGPDSLIVADTWTVGKVRSEQEANVKLISAAPEMADALHILIEVAREHCDEGPAGQGWRSKELDALIAKSEAVLRKAGIL